MEITTPEMKYLDPRTILSTTLYSTEETIPLLGFGAADYPFSSDNEAVKESILHAIELCWIFVI